MINSINNSYQNYTKSIFSAQAKAKADKTEKTDDDNKLSKKAEEYLEKLKKKYKNIDFIVKDFESGEDTGKYHKGGSGDYSCIITPDLLEQMANDESVAAKYEGLIDEGTSQIEELRKNVNNFEFAGMVDKYGFEINESGEINYYALLKEGLPSNSQKTAESETETATETETPQNKNYGNYFKHDNTGKIPLLKGSTTDELFKAIEQASKGMFGSNVEFLESGKKDIFNPHYSFKA